MSDTRVIISNPLQHGPRWMTEAIQRTDSWNTVTTRTSGERIGVYSVLPLIADGLADGCADTFATTIACTRYCLVPIFRAVASGMKFRNLGQEGCHA